MAFKRTGVTGGSANQLGGQDWDHLIDYFEGVANVESLDINSNTSYRSGKLRKRGTGSPFYYIENTSAIVADRTITEPLLTTNDTRVYEANTATLTGKSMSGSTNTFTNIGDSALSAHTSTKITITDRTHLPPLAAYTDTAQTFTAINKFDQAIRAKPVANPTTDASYGMFFSNSADSNKPYFKSPAGVLTNLSGSTGGSSPYVYDNFTSTYTLTSNGQISANSLWRRIYAGQHPVTGAGDPGLMGVRAPTGGAFTNVFFEYPYSGALASGTSPPTSSSLVLTESPYFTDIDYTLSIRTVAQRRTPTPMAWEAVWLFFRYNEQGFAPGAAGSNFHHYYMVLKSNGQIELGRKDNTTSAEEQTFLSTSATYTWALGVWNKVRVRAIANHITVWIDDIQKIDIVDDGSFGTHVDSVLGTIATLPPSAYMASGKLGLYNEDAEVEFSPMTITDLSSSGSTAPATASYVTLATDSSLVSERVATAGNGISLTDAGAGGALTIAARNRILTRFVTEQDVVNTVTETDILAYSVPASTLGTDKALRVVIHADHLNNSGGTSAMTFKIKYGATTMLSGTTGSFSAGAVRRAINIQFTLWARNSATSQGVSGFFNFGNRTAATTGVGDFALTDLQTTQFVGANAAENSAVGKTLSLTVTHANAASTISFRRLYAVIEVLD